jgi:pyroglutamyl-peptidase
MTIIQIRSKKDIRVLLTGYGPFLSYPVNPSEQVARLLDQRKISLENAIIHITSIVCTVDSVGSSTVSEMIKRLGPLFPYDLVIHLGLDANAKQIKLELCAFNNCVATGDKFEDQLFDFLPSTVNVHGLMKWMKSNKDTFTFSRDAGTYYCNEQLFLTLSSLLDSEGPVSSGAMFVHLPEMVEFQKASVSIENLITALVLAQVGFYQCFICDL